MLRFKLHKFFINFCYLFSQFVFPDFSLVLWHCWLGDRKGVRPVKKVGCWFVGGDDLTGAFARLIAPVITSKNYLIQVHLDKWPLKQRESLSFPEITPY